MIDLCCDNISVWMSLFVITYLYGINLKPFPPESCIKLKINLNFYFHTSLWCLKGLQKIFRGIAKKCENKNLS